jgi:hypothetical protein
MLELTVSKSQDSSTLGLEIGGSESCSLGRKTSTSAHEQETCT